MPLEFNFNSYWRPTLQRLPLLLVVSFVLAAAVYFITQRVGPLPQVHYSYLVSLSQREQTPEYEFDGYYALQATDLFSSTLAEWLTTPEVVVAAHSVGGLDLVTEDPRALTRLVEARKTAPQLVEVTVKGSSGANAEKLTTGLIEVMKQNVALYHDEGLPALGFKVVNTQPFSGARDINEPLIASATFILSLILLINLTLLLSTASSSFLTPNP